MCKKKYHIPSLQNYIFLILTNLHSKCRTKLIKTLYMKCWFIRSYCLALWLCVKGFTVNLLVMVTIIWSKCESVWRWSLFLLWLNIPHYCSCWSAYTCVTRQSFTYTTDYIKLSGDCGCPIFECSSWYFY